MKRMFAVLFAVLMLMTAVFAVAETPLAGAWSVAESTDITEENKAVFDKALDGLVGVDYEPVAYLGSQLVAGMNHCFLCKATVVYPDAVPTLALVFIYEDLKGNTTITHIADFDIGAFSQAQH